MDSTGTPSLDELLAQIEKQTGVDESGMSSQGTPNTSRPVSKGMEVIDVFESSLVGQSSNRTSPSPLHTESKTGVKQLSRSMIGGGATTNESYGGATGLSMRQQRLPKLSYRMLGSIAAMLVMVLGLGSAVFLTQQSQDIRQYASDPSRQEIPQELRQYMADGEQVPSPDSQQELPQQKPAVMQPQQEDANLAWYKQPLVIVGLALVISALLVVGVFLHWLFAA